MRLALALLFSATCSAHIAVTTSQYDNARTGSNENEKILTPRNVNVRQFGKVFSYAVDGDVYAQPLYVPALQIPGKGTRNVVFIATEHDSVYAFDASGNPATPLWVVRFFDYAKGITTVPDQAVGCPFISPEIGITPTPVIDTQTRTLYVLVRTREANGSGEAKYWQRLHALDLLTGAERTGSPVTISASFKTTKKGFFGGTSEGSTGFLALHENPRASLLLTKGKVYLTWASSCDVGPYYGLVIAYDAHTLKQAGAFNVAPEGGQGGIWQSDTGPAADEAGHVYLTTGNGLFNAASGGRDYGDSLLKLSLLHNGLTVMDYFTPSDEAQLSSEDADLGSGGPVLVPPQASSDPALIVFGGKGGVIYVANRDQLGRFHYGRDPASIQKIPLGKSIKSAPAYWQGHLYYIAGDNALRDFRVAGGKLQPNQISNMSVIEPGATPTVSSNGANDGIVWFIETRIWNGRDQHARLYAFDATNVAHELWDSRANEPRDQAGIARRFNIPTVADGRVYVGCSGQVDVYGLLPGVQPAPATRSKRN